ncbi:Uncharacterised protein [Mycobacteroides abscessus]|nr:Uncharacterised protein [Mycobacteroides abscessus]
MTAFADVHPGTAAFSRSSWAGVVHEYTPD